ncbi:MAG: hypothetical protein KGL39_14245 [Patescibacteria group bacterium]|nr:hypothetical protein [Patescibacteria group bacterium]
MVKAAEDIPTLRRRTLAMLDGHQNAMGEADCLIELQLLEESELKETDKQERKKRPVATGVVDYFPDALVEIALVSWNCSQQHNPGSPMKWDRSKSTDEGDALMRHFIDRGKRDSDGMRHSAKVAWRALALLQKEIEADHGDASAPVLPEFIHAGDGFVCSDCKRAEAFQALETRKAFGGRDFVFDTAGGAHLLSHCTKVAG